MQIDAADHARPARGGAHARRGRESRAWSAYSWRELLEASRAVTLIAA